MLERQQLISILMKSQKKTEQNSRDQGEAKMSRKKF